MKIGNHYRITYDKPAMDVTIEFLGTVNNTPRGRILEIHSSNDSWTTGESLPLYMDLLTKVEEILTPEVGFYSYSDDRQFYFDGGNWRILRDANKHVLNSNFKAGTLHKVADVVSAEW